MLSAADKLRGVVAESPAPTAQRSGCDGVFTLANRISTIGVLDRLGISHSTTARGEMAVCPGCGEDGALVGKNGGLKCLHDRCSHAGPKNNRGFRTNVDLAAQMQSMPAAEAATWLCSEFGIAMPATRKTNGDSRNEPPAGRFDDEQPQHAPKTDSWPEIDATGIFAPLEPVKYLLAGLDMCAGAPVLFAGYGFSGKTVTAQALALAVTAGQRALGAFTVLQGRVLHVDYEQGPRLTRAKYQRLAAAMMVSPSDIAEKLTLVSMPQVYLDGGLAEAFLVGKCAGVDLMIIDSLRAACPTLDENDSQIRLVLDMLTRVSVKTGTTILVIHHARKPQRDAAGGAKMAIRGSGAIFDACGSVLVFEAEKGQPTRVSHEKARTSGRPADDFTIRVEDVEVDGDPVAGLLVVANAASSRGDAADDVERQRNLDRTAKLQNELRELFVREPGQAGADVIAGKLGRRPVDVRAALKLLVDSGHVLATGSTSNRRHQWAGRE
ncbi:MAG: AAA family ATPase [Polyangiaceae bacterium]